MLPIIGLSLAWAEALGWSYSEIASFFFDIDLATVIQAGASDLCPRCGRRPAEQLGHLFVPESATAPEQVKGRLVVKCLCKIAYWCVGVHAVRPDQPIGAAAVRPLFGGADIAPTEPMPPGRNNTLDTANQVASQFRPEHYAAIQALIDNSYRPLSARRQWPEYYETRSSFTLPPFGPLKAP